MFFGIPQRYAVDIYGFYFEEYILGYLSLWAFVMDLSKYFLMMRLFSLGHGHFWIEDIWMEQK